VRRNVLTVGNGTSSVSRICADVQAPKWAEIVVEVGGEMRTSSSPTGSTTKGPVSELFQLASDDTPVARTPVTRESRACPISASTHGHGMARLRRVHGMLNALCNALDTSRIPETSIRTKEAT
jgi:hypothetical protein